MAKQRNGKKGHQSNFKPIEKGKNPFQEAFRQGMQITMDEDFYEPINKDKLDNTFKEQLDE
jgi:hypothetical protein